MLGQTTTAKVGPPFPRQLETVPGGSGLLLPASRHEVAFEPLPQALRSATRWLYRE